MSILESIPQLQGVSRYIREYNGAPTFEVLSGNITICTLIFKDLTLGHWTIAFTPFRFHKAGSIFLHSYRHLLIYNTNIEEKVFNQQQTELYHDTKIDYNDKFDMKVDGKSIKIEDIDYIGFNVVAANNNYIDLILMNYITPLEINNAIRDLKARRVLAKLWQYFPGSLINATADGTVVVHKIPINKTIMRDILVPIKNDKMVDIISYMNHAASLFYDGWKGKQWEDNQSLRNKDIDHLLQSVYSVFNDNTDKDLYSYFIHLHNYLYHHKLLVNQSPWLDNDGKFYIVENDNRSVDSKRFFIDRWDPYDILNGLSLKNPDSSRIKFIAQF